MARKKSTKKGQKTKRGALATLLKPVTRALWRPRLYAFVTIFLLTAGVGLAWGSWQNLCARCPSVAQIRTWEPEQTSKLLSADGDLIVELGRERKTPVSIHAMPDYVPEAVVAIEDKRFYEHGGYDPRGIARAVFGQLTGRNLGGGSTITQQLARNMFENAVGFERKYTRKLRELQVALELERSYDKDQILESYINEIYMGRGPIHGFQAAARSYFGKNLTEVNPAEAALLAAILNRPGTYNPFTRPENALQRRNLVLTRMADQGFLDDAEAARWKAEPLPTEDHATGSLYGPAPYFEEWVRQILDSRFGEEVYSGGLTVYTTLDLDMQAAAQESMEWGWRRIENLPNFAHEPYEAFDTVDVDGSNTPYLQGMFIALDPETGHVKALIGGRDFDDSKFDRARQARRQAGSSFKPFVYTAAIASGIPASHIVVDQPVVYPQVDGTEWRPRNFDGEFRGPITIREGLRRSINIIAIKLGVEEVGLETVAKTAERMGIRTEIERFPSTTIGATEVIPLHVAEAYSAYATLGTKVRPFPILRVENSEGEVVWEPRPERTRVLDSLEARIVVDMLQDAANNGTGGNHRNPGIEGTLGYRASVPTAGKTGTTNDGTNTWFNGFTPNLVANVWFGMDRPVPMAEDTGTEATGGYYAAPVWGRFIRHVYYGTAEDGSPAPVTPLPPRVDTTDSVASHVDARRRRSEVVDTAPTVAPDTLDAEPLFGDELAGGRYAGGILPVPDPWPYPPGLTTREVDERTGTLWSQWCENPEENRYIEYYIPGTEPTEYCDDTRSRIFRMPLTAVEPPSPSSGSRPAR